MRTLKVAICIPVYGMTHAKFTQSLANLIIRSLGARIEDAAGEPVKLELETFMVSCSMLTESRHRLVAEALSWEADHMLCLDADHVFPADALLRTYRVTGAPCHLVEHRATAPRVGIHDDSRPWPIAVGRRERDPTRSVGRAFLIFVRKLSVREFFSHVKTSPFGSSS